MKCARVQEEIAWARLLSAEDQAHALGCPACSATLAQFAELEALLVEPGEIEVPASFADAVMARVGRAARGAAEPALASWGEAWAARLRLSLAYVGALASLVMLFGAELH